MKEKILELRAKGYTYNQIKEELGCSKSTISYHLGEGQKQKAKTRNLKNKEHFVREKFYRFKYKLTKPLKDMRELDTSRSLYHKVDWFQRKLTENLKAFNVNDFFEKYNGETYCYLTGDPIDLSKPSTYHFDHIQPLSKGGNSNIDNLGLASKTANMMKTDMTVDELIEMCIKVLVNFDIIEKT